MEKCIVLVSDHNYFEKAFYTILNLRTIGHYSDTIVLITDETSISRLSNITDFNSKINKYSVILKTFENIDLTNILDKIKQRPFKNSIDNRELVKSFQWHKIHVFDVYFKQWKYILYLDSGMNIYKSIDPLWEIVREYGNDVLLAHSDTYPLFKNNYRDQFDTDSYPELFGELENLVDLTKDNFQTTMMLFSSDIINEHTKSELILYSNKFPFSRTNEQGIMNIYFNGIYKMWEPLPVYWKGTYTYDFWNRDNMKPTDYILTKYKRI